MAKIEKGFTIRSKNFTPGIVQLQNDVTALDRNVNVQPGILVVDDPLRSFVTTLSTDWRWFKMAEFTIDGIHRGFHIDYTITSRYVQSIGVLRAMATADVTAIQFLRNRISIGTSQVVLMREDANPQNYHLLVKVGSFNRHYAMAQRVFKTRVLSTLTYSVDYVDTGLIGDNTQTEVVTGYTGYTQIAFTSL